MGSATATYDLKGRWVRCKEVTNSDTNTTVTIADIPAYTVIPPHGAFIVVTTAFAGGTPSLDIGDGDDDDGWIDTTAITEASAGTYADVDADLAVTGKYYSSAGQIKAKVSASLTAGAAYVFIYMIDVSDIIDD